MPWLSNAKMSHANMLGLVYSWIKFGMSDVKLNRTKNLLVPPRFHTKCRPSLICSYDTQRVLPLVISTSNFIPGIACCCGLRHPNPPRSSLLSRRTLMYLSHQARAMLLSYCPLLSRRTLWGFYPFCTAYCYMAPPRDPPYCDPRL